MADKINPKPVMPPDAQPTWLGSDMPEYLAQQLTKDINAGLQDPDITPWDIVPTPGSMVQGAARRISGAVGKDFLKMAGKTAIARGKKISQPTKELIDEFKSGFMKVLHHGSGHAQADTRAIRKFKNVVDEYDVNFSPNRDILGKGNYDKAISNYVLNVLPSKERADAIKDIGSSLNKGGRGLITVRGKGSKIIGTPEAGGLITKKQTYQKTYSPQELEKELGEYFQDVKIIRGSQKSDSITASVGGYKPNIMEQPIAPKPKSTMSPRVARQEPLYGETASFKIKPNIMDQPVPQTQKAPVAPRMVKQQPMYGQAEYLPRTPGKKMGENIYVHKNYIKESDIPNDQFNKAKSNLPNDFDYTAVKYNKNDKSLSFIHSPDFNIADEPTVGKSIKVFASGKTKVTNPSKDPLIWHHKWKWVGDDYKGFNVQESKARSAQWRNIVGVNKDVSSRIGRKSYWEKEIVPKLEKK